MTLARCIFTASATDDYHRYLRHLHQ